MRGSSGLYSHGHGISSVVVIQLTLAVNQVLYTGLFQMIVVEVAVKTECKIYGQYGHNELSKNL
jgi:hypothetical protein